MIGMPVMKELTGLLAGELLLLWTTSSFFQENRLLRLVKNIFFLEICGKLSNKSTVYTVYKEKSLLGTNMIFTRSSDLVVRSLDSQYRRSGFKTAGWVLGQLSLSAFRSRSNEPLELLVSY